MAKKQGWWELKIKPHKFAMAPKLLEALREDVEPSDVDLEHSQN